MTKLTVLLVDDEAIERQVIEKMLRKDEIRAQSLTFIQARNGEEACEFCEKTEVDIIFMDISMPVMDGLEATKKIKDNQPSVDIIMLTAHDTFDYAKQAIEYGAKAYVLKPAAEKEVMNTFNKVTKARELKQADEKQQKKQIARSAFIEALICDTPEYFTTTVAVALVGAKTSEEELTTNINDDRMIIGPVFGAHIPIAWIDVESTDDALELMKQACLKDSVIRFSMGRVKAARELRESYEEALLSYYDLVDRPDIAYNVYKSGLKPTLKDIDTCQKNLIIAFENTNADELSACYDRYVHTLSQLTHHQLPKMRRYLSILLEQLTHVGITDSIFPLQQEMDLVTHREALQTLVKDFLLKQCVMLKRKHQNASPVEQAVRYVDEHFKDPGVSLEQLADEVDLSLYHLSKAFKKRTGQPFVDYLRDKRLTYAKTLLRDGELPLKAIAYEAGFSDPNYFSRLFKKVTGLPPSKYVLDKK